jgi:lysophospholipase L1-like esterase
LMNNTSIPSLRAAQALDVHDLTFPATDTLKLAQFIVGSRNPIDVVEATMPTFVTVEVGANDVLGAATRGDITLLTSTTSFNASIDALAARLVNTGAKVAISNVPNVTSIPHFTRASVLWCLKNGVCPGVPATVPFSLASFTIDNSCAPTSAGGVGDSYLLTFPTLGAVVSTLSAGRFASVNCATDNVLLAPAATPTVPSVPAGATINPTEFAAINAAVAAFNTKIAAVATANGWALVDFAALLAAQAANIPPIPSFSTPTNLFGTLFSQDGIHPAKAGQKIIANGFIAAINAKYGTAITAIP